MIEEQIEDAIEFFQVPHRFIHILMSDYTVPAEFGLNQSDIRTLMMLRNQGLVSMKELGNWVGMAKGSFTQVVDKLVRTGLAERSSNPRDRRMVMVSITSRGKRMTTVLDRDLRVYLEEKFKILETEEQKDLERALDILSNITFILEKRRDENR